MNSKEWIEFHESGRTYYWHKPASTVTRTINGAPIAYDCYNLKVARTKVRNK